MELTIKAAIFHDLSNIETFYVEVSETNQIIVKKRLILERERMIDCLKNLKKGGLIGNIFQPKNKALKKDLDRLVFIKKELKKSIQSIKDFYN